RDAWRICSTHVSRVLQKRDSWGLDCLLISFSTFAGGSPMKRVMFTLLIVAAAGSTWRAVDSFRMRHPVSGKEIAVPGKNGPNTLLVSGWKTTPAGRQLASGDMILSGQLSPDGKLFAFTNTGYTRHNLHIVDLSTEKEIATFPMEQAWSGLAFSPDGSRIYVSSGAAYPGSD